MNFDMVTNLSCPKCESYVEVWHRWHPPEAPYKTVSKPSREGRQRDMDAL